MAYFLYNDEEKNGRISMEVKIDFNEKIEICNNPAKDILAISSKRHKIEDCFRVMKTSFSARPVFHHTKDRIIAHFMIYYTALLICRLLEKKLDMNGSHFSVNNIIATLQNMDVANIEDMCYMSTYTCSQVCTALSTVFDLRLDKKYYQPIELNKQLKKYWNSVFIQQPLKMKEVTNGVF